MKKLKSVLLVLLALAVAMPAAGCFSNKKNLEGKLAIAMLDAGFGTAWMDEIVEKFIDENPGVEVDVDKSGTVSATFESQIKSGPRHNETDLYILQQVNFKKYGEENYTVDGVKYDSLLEDLTGIYEAKVPGEDKKLIDKMKPEYVEFFRNDNGKFYAMPMISGPSGFVYNVDLFEENKVLWGLAEKDSDPLVMPDNTDDFLAMIARIYQKSVVEVEDAADRIYPLTWTGKVPSYWNTVEFALFAQYAGYSGYKDFWQGKDSLGRLSPEGFASLGRLEVMKFIEGIVAPKDSEGNALGNVMDGYCYPNSIQLSHTDSQTYFMDGKAAITVVGNWLEREMEKDYPRGSKNIAVMKMPVLSAALEKYADDPAKLAEIKSLQFSLGPMIMGAIPVYSKEKELAKEFLQFMAKEASIEALVRESLALSPFEFEPTEEFLAATTPFHRSQFEIDKTAKYVFDEKFSSKLFYRNESLNFYPNNTFPIDLLSSTNLAARKTPQEIFESQLAYVRGNWSTFVAKL